MAGARLQVGAHVDGQLGQQAAYGVHDASLDRSLRARALLHRHPQRVAAAAADHGRHGGRAGRTQLPRRRLRAVELQAAAEAISWLKQASCAGV